MQGAAAGGGRGEFLRLLLLWWPRRRSSCAKGAVCDLPSSRLPAQLPCRRGVYQSVCSQQIGQEQQVQGQLIESRAGARSAPVLLPGPLLLGALGCELWTALGNVVLDLSASLQGGSFISSLWFAVTHSCSVSQKASSM